MWHLRGCSLGRSILVALVARLRKDGVAFVRGKGPTGSRRERIEFLDRRAFTPQECFNYLSAPQRAWPSMRWTGAPSCMRLQKRSGRSPRTVKLRPCAHRRLRRIGPFSSGSAFVEAGCQTASIFFLLPGPDNPTKNACFENRISLLSIIEFPVREKQGIRRQPIATIAFSRDTQPRMRTDGEQCSEGNHRSGCRTRLSRL